MPGNSFAINSSTNWEQLTVSMTYLLSDPSMQFIEQTIHDTHCPPECLAPIQSSLVKLSIHPEQTDPLQNSQIQHEDSKKLNRLNISRNDEGFKTTKEESPKRANTNNAKKHDGMIDPVLDSVRTTCPFCEKQFQDIPKLEAHVKNLHRNPKKVYKCDMCQTYCYSQKKLEQHKVIHRPDYFFKCNICEAKYKWKASLKKHILRIHTEHDTTFTMTRNLTQHIKRCHDFPLQVCQFCGKEVKNLKTHEWRHEKRIKQSEYEYCFLCTNNFRHRSSMDNHLIGHATVFTCSKCGEACQVSEELFKHRRRKHGPTQAFSCMLCQKKFFQSSTYYQHVLTHAGIKPYKCGICRKDFTRRNCRAERYSTDLKSRRF